MTVLLKHIDTKEKEKMEQKKKKREVESLEGQNFILLICAPIHYLKVN